MISNFHKAQVARIAKSLHQPRNRSKVRPRNARSKATQPINPNELYIKAADRDNYGRVVRYDTATQKAQVRFVSPEGNIAEPWLPAELLEATGSSWDTILGERSFNEYLEDGFRFGRP